MSEWITQSCDFLVAVGSFLISSPIFYIVGLLILIVACRLFKGLVGG